MEARLQGEDLAGVEEGLKEYAAPAARETVRRAAREAQGPGRPGSRPRAKTAVLTKNIQAQFNELQALIDRYLDDEAFTSYTEALDRKRAEKARGGEGQGEGDRQAAGRWRTPRPPAQTPAPEAAPCSREAAPATPARAPAAVPRQRQTRQTGSDVPF